MKRGKIMNAKNENRLKISIAVAITVITVSGSIYTIINYLPTEKMQENMQKRADTNYEAQTAKLKDGTISQAIIQIGPCTQKTLKQLKQDGFRIIGTTTYKGSTTGFIIEKENP